MGGTLIAASRAVRALYMVVLTLGALVFLMPNLGIGDFLLEEQEGRRLLELGVGFVFVALLIEHVRTQILMKRQSYLARAMLRNQPEARKEEAIKILIGALDSNDERVVGYAHRELKRLTHAELGSNSAEWRRWLKDQQRAGMEKETAQ